MILIKCGKVLPELGVLEALPLSIKMIRFIEGMDKKDVLLLNLILRMNST